MTPGRRRLTKRRSARPVQSETAGGKETANWCGKTRCHSRFGYSSGLSLTLDRPPGFTVNNEHRVRTAGVIGIHPDRRNDNRKEQS